MPKFAIEACNRIAKASCYNLIFFLLSVVLIFVVKHRQQGNV